VFHAMTYGAITIAFWPHLVMMLAFLPLERYAAWLRERLARRRGAPGDRAGDAREFEGSALP